MATVTISKREDGVARSATFSFTGDGGAQTITLGFVPTEVQIINETDVILWSKIDPMAAANSIKQVAAGTTTLDTGSAIVINADGTLTLSATLAASGKAIKGRAAR